MCVGEEDETGRYGEGRSGVVGSAEGIHFLLLFPCCSCLCEVGFGEERERGRGREGRIGGIPRPTRGNGCNWRKLVGFVDVAAGGWLVWSLDDCRNGEYVVSMAVGYAFQIHVSRPRIRIVLLGDAVSQSLLYHGPQEQAM